jgi:hypothetical protein
MNAFGGSPAQQHPAPNAKQNVADDAKLQDGMGVVLFQRRQLAFARPS